MDKINEVPPENFNQSDSSEANFDKLSGPEQLKLLISKAINDPLLQNEVTVPKKVDPQVIAEAKARTQAAIEKALGESRRDTSWKELSGLEQLKVLCSLAKDTLLIREK